MLDAFKVDADSRYAWHAVPVAGTALVALLGIVVPQATVEWASVPLVLGGLTIGMSHGAADFHLIRRGLNPSATFLKYLSIMAVAVAWWVIHPTSAVAAFLLLTTWHFAGEEADRWSLDGDGQGMNRLALMAVHGGIVVGLPLLFHPIRSEIFLDRVGRVGFSSIGFDGLLQAIATVGLMLIAVVIFIGLGVLAWRLPGRRACQIVAESILLIAAALVLPPQFFIGTYLLLWHAPFHYGRLVSCDGVNRGRAFWRDTLVFHIPAVVAIGVLTYLSWRRDIGSESILTTVAAATVLTYLVVTPPHHWLGNHHRWLGIHWLGSNARPSELGPSKPIRSSTPP